MTSHLLTVVFLLADPQPPTDAPAQAAAPAATTTAEAPAEPKMICKYESITGSRLSKQKVCRPEGADKDEQSTALQRQLDRFGSRGPTAPGFGN